VCMGGRVAEELSRWNSSERILSYHGLTFFLLLFYAVYGPQNVTSGASSDLRHATSTANAMVKVKNSSVYLGFEVELNDTVFRSKALGLFRESRTSVPQRPRR